MQTGIRVWSYRAQFFVEWEMCHKKKIVEEYKTYILRSTTFFFFENRAVYEIMWKNNVEPGRPQVDIWRMRITCRIPKATDTHSEYFMFIPFPLQKWLHESASMLRSYVHWLSCCNKYKLLVILYFWGCSEPGFRFRRFSGYQLNAHFLYSITIYMLHYNLQNVSSSTMLIFRRTNCIITTSGIVTPCKRLYGMPVESGLQSQPAYRTAIYREWRYQRL